MRLKDQIAVITGAGRGIGRSIALAYAEEGAYVALVARSQEQLAGVAREVEGRGAKALVLPCDISISERVSELADTVREEFGRVDILVNNAGISRRSKFLEYDDDTWLEVLRVNLFGTYLCTKAFLPMIQEVGQGRIIMMASTGAKNPVPFNTAYGASKSGLLGLTRSLAAELAFIGYTGITVNAICPFFVDTEMFAGPKGYVAQMVEALDLSNEAVVARALGDSLQKRLLEPREVAALAVYLASEEARGITGQAINVCGGRVFY